MSNLLEDIFKIAGVDSSKGKANQLVEASVNQHNMQQIMDQFKSQIDPLFLDEAGRQHLISLCEYITTQLEHNFPQKQINIKNDISAE